MESNMTSKRTIIKTIHSLGFVLLFMTNSYGAACLSPRPPQTFYVSTSGNDLNDGASPPNAFRHLQTGVNCLFLPGDRLFILGGTYTEFVSVIGKKGTPDKPIVIEGMLGPSGPVRYPAVTIQGTITSLKNSSHVFQFHRGSATAP